LSGKTQKLKKNQTKSFRPDDEIRSYSTFCHALSYAIDFRALSFLGIKIFSFIYFYFLAVLSNKMAGKTPEKEFV
jgi:hypothetical protein